MKNTPHTPGPWTVLRESADPSWTIVVASGGRIVANVNSETGPDIPPLVSTKMPADANARLMAAAPELFALVRAWLITDPHGTHSQACADAIAKAKGTP